MTWTRRIVVAYDGSAPARSALARAAALARPGDALTIIHARRGGEEPTQLLADARTFAQHHGVTADTVAAVGDPAREILALADRDHADLLVVAQHPGRAVNSLGDEIVHGAPCDVLVVRAS